MSVFSDLLSEYITMKDVGVYPLSQFCGLDRSFMYKIINGKRNPSGEDVVRKMAQVVLMLKTAQPMLLGRPPGGTCLPVMAWQSCFSPPWG